MEDRPLASDSAEEVLRRRLASLANGAPVAIADLDRSLVGRVARARRRRRMVSGAAALAILVCGAAGAGAWALSGQGSAPQTGQFPPAPPRGSLVCPQDLGTFRLGTAHPGIGKTMVPGTPAEAIVCGYAAGTKPPVVVTVPAASDLPAVVAQLNAVSTFTGASCAETQAGGASQILIRFGYRAGAEVDVLAALSGTNCPTETNGVLRGSLPAALNIPYLVDQNISPPPTPWTTSGNIARPASGPEHASQSGPPQAPVPTSSSQPAPDLPSERP
jgi:hypothetical protein